MNTLKTDEQDGIEALISKAFAIAREKGKPDWGRMKLAVLNNRLLQITRQEFNVQKFGASNLIELLSRLPSLVKIDQDEVIYLIYEPNSGFEAQKIRSDIWKIIIDLDQGSHFNWDTSTNKPIDASLGRGIILPILTIKELQAWKQEFASLHAEPERLDSWLMIDNGSPKGLSKRTGFDWIRFFKNKITKKLIEWARANAVPLEQLFQAHMDPTLSESEELRKIVYACISVMNHDELSELKISPLVIARAKANGKL